MPVTCTNLTQCAQNGYDWYSFAVLDLVWNEREQYLNCNCKTPVLALTEIDLALYKLARPVLPCSLATQLAHIEISFHLWFQGTSSNITVEGPGKEPNSWDVPQGIGEMTSVQHVQFHLSPSLHAQILNICFCYTWNWVYFHIKTSLWSWKGAHFQLIPLPSKLLFSYVPRKYLITLETTLFRESD